MSYVTDEYIGTLECFTSSKLYGKQLNRCKEFRPVLFVSKPSANITEVTITWETRATEGNF